MKTIKNNLFILGLIWKASPSYLLVASFTEILRAFLAVLDLYIVKLTVNALASKTVSLPGILFLFSAFILIKIAFTQINVFLSVRLTMITEINLVSYFKNIIFEKSKELEISFYEDTQFYDDYHRAISDMDQRAVAVVNNLGTFFGNLLTLILVGFIYFDYAYIILSAFIVMKRLLYTQKLNQTNHQLFVEATPINRKLEYYARIFYSRDFIKELKIFRLYDLFIEKNDKTWEQYIGLEQKYHNKIISNTILDLALTYISDFLITALACYKIIRRLFPIGDFLFYVNSFDTFSNKFTDLIIAGPEIQKNSLYIDNIKKFLEYTPEITTDGLKPDKNNFNLRMEHVTFAYPNAPDSVVLNDITVDVSDGMKLAVVGENGSGKSTFIKLLLGLYPVNVGTVSLNCVNYSQYDIFALRMVFGVVFQDFCVYPLSAAENVLMREISCSDDYALVTESLQFSGLLEKINSLEKGVHSVITKEFDESGVYFSGGELQMLAIARAYARKSKVLIFDEPSSALDAVTEQYLFQRLQALGENKTIIYVSHRLSCVTNADWILVFDDGKITEQGNHRNLMGLKGKYHSMYTQQAEQYSYTNDC